MIGSGNLAASGTFASYAPSGEGLTGEGSYAPVSVTYTATAVQQRTVTADALNLGRQISGVDLSLLVGQSTTFSSSGADSAYTRITVNGQLFNSTASYVLGVSGSGNLAASGTFASYAASGEGLTGEGSYAAGDGRLHSHAVA